MIIIKQTFRNGNQATATRESIFEIYDILKCTKSITRDRL